MNNLLPEFEKRFSCRKFVPGKALQREQICMLLEAARRTPSGSNRQPWKFVVVQEEDTIQKMSELTFKQQFMKNASCVIVVLGDPSVRDTKPTEERLNELKEAGAFSDSEIEVLKTEIRAVATDQVKEMAKIVRDCAIAAYGLMLQAARMELGTCWVSIKDKTGLRNLCKIPDNFELVCMIPIGKPDSVPGKPRPRNDIESFSFSEYFGKGW